MLLLTHISARYVGPEAWRLEEEAKKIFPNSHVVRDFEEVEIK